MGVKQGNVLRVKCFWIYISDLEDVVIEQGVKIKILA